MAVGLRIVIILLVLTAISFGMSQGMEERRSERMTEDHSQYRLPDDCDFGKTRGMFLSDACSPVITDRGFRGIVINAPKEILPGSGPGEGTGFHAFSIPIFGTYVHNLGTPLDLKDDVPHSILWVAVNVGSNRTYSGKIARRGRKSTPPVREDDRLSPKDLAGRTITGYCNPNLAEILELPEEKAEYVVYATLGPYKSNAVRIRVGKR
jgi:hypothetical protein